MLIKHKVRFCIIILLLATIMFLPTSAFAALFDVVKQIGDTSERINLDKLRKDTADKFSNIYFKEKNLLPVRASETKNNKARDSVLLAAKKGGDKFSIGTQRSSKEKFTSNKNEDGSASSYEITSNDNQTYTLTRQGLQMEPLPAEEVESIREFTEILVGQEDYMIAMQEAQGILDAVTEGSVLGEFRGDMNTGASSEFLPEDKDSLFNREAVGKNLTNRYESFGQTPGDSIHDLKAAVGAGKGKAADFGVNDAFGGLATLARAVGGASATGAIGSVGGIILFGIKVYNSLPDPSKSSGEKFLDFLEKYPGMTKKQKDQTRYEFYENSCKNSNEYCDEYKAEKKKREEQAKKKREEQAKKKEEEKPAPDDFGGGIPERIELTKSQKDWWATVLTTGWIPEETNPGPDGAQGGGFDLSPEEHARLLQELMIIGDVPWNPLSGQPVPDQDYRNYQIANDGTITITDLTLAGQPLDDDDGSFGTRKQPKRLGGPKPVGGIDQNLPEGEPFQGSSDNRPNVPFPAPMK